MQGYTVALVQGKKIRSFMPEIYDLSIKAYSDYP
jgi:hypothetical protein